MIGNKSILPYIWCIVLIAIAVIYLIVAHGEYNDLVELLSYGIHGETLEKQIEISLFLGSSLVYLGLLVWIIKVRLTKRSISSLYNCIAGVNNHIHCIENHRCSTCWNRTLCW